MTAQEQVQQAYPDAKCWRNPANLGQWKQWKIYDGTPRNIALSGSFATHDEAWRDAAKRIVESV